MLRSLVAAFAVACAFGASSSVCASPPHLENIHTIGVSVNLGEQAENKYIGLLAFGNKLTYLPISDWKLNELAADQVQKALAARFSVQITPIGEEEFSQAKRRFQWNQSKSVGDVVKSLPPSNVDAYLILLPSEEQLPSPSNQIISGLGAYLQSSRVVAPHSGEAIVHLNYSIYLVDARTGHVIATSEGKPSRQEKQSLTESLLLLQRPLLCPHAYTSDTNWPETAEALSEDQKQVLQSDLVGLIKDSVPYTLMQMGLGLDAPSPQQPDKLSKPAGQP